MAKNPNAASMLPDCAVSLFSDTFSLPRCHPAMPNAPAACATTNPVAYFPAEVLLIIFKLVYREERRRRFDDDTSKEDYLSPSLFPYAVAAVCSYWRDVMALVPEFWTSVVILVDQHPTPLPAVECQLAWSQDLPLDVAVTRSPGVDMYMARDKDESVRTHRVISRLLPHLHRFRNLSFDVILGSSLPSFPNDFKGSAPLLQCLKLECMQDDGGISHSDTQNEATATLATQTEQEGFQCPALCELTIKGRNFYNAGRLGPSWSGMLFGVQSLTVSHFRPRDGEALTICDFMLALKPIQHLLNLTIVDLHIDISESPLASFDDMNDVKLPELETLKVRDLEHFKLSDPSCFEPLETFLYAVGPRLQSTLITRCVTSYVYDFTGHLHLGGIESNLWALLRCWHGKELSVSRCSGFADYILEDMGHQGARDLVAPNLCALFISDCLRISAAGLKCLVRGRRRSSRNDQLSPLKKLFVSGYAPYISLNDRFWFTKKLHRFGYRGEELESDSSVSGDEDGSDADSDDSD